MVAIHIPNNSVSILDQRFSDCSSIKIYSKANSKTYHLNYLKIPQTAGYVFVGKPLETPHYCPGTTVLLGFQVDHFKNLNSILYLAPPTGIYLLVDWPWDRVSNLAAWWGLGFPCVPKLKSETEMEEPCLGRGSEGDDPVIEAGKPEATPTKCVPAEICCWENAPCQLSLTARPLPITLLNEHLLAPYS